MQWSFLNLDGENSQSNFSAWQRGGEFSNETTGTYDLQGVIVPEAPYDGGGLGFGPLIDNKPTSRQTIESPSGGGEAHFSNRIYQSFEVDLHTVSLGPVVTGRIGPIGIQGGAGLALDFRGRAAVRTRFRRQ